VSPVEYAGGKRSLRAYIAVSPNTRNSSNYGMLTVSQVLQQLSSLLILIDFFSRKIFKLYQSYQNAAFAIANLAFTIDRLIRVGITVVTKIIILSFSTCTSVV